MGGTSQVFLVHHVKLDSLRVIKRISKKKHYHELLLKEANILKNLKHSCIPTIYDIEEDNSYSYIIQEYIDGINLKEYLRKNKKIPEKEIINFGIQMCNLINYLHCNNPPILHLDIKPENIIVKEKTLKLIDFGSSIISSDLSSQKALFGTKIFSAPEIYRLENVDVRTDVYSIGVLLCFMTQGIEFTKNIIENKKINLEKCYSKELENIINKCLKKEPSQRYNSVLDLKEKLIAIEKSYIKQSYQTITFGIAGSKRGIGTSHLSFMICNYYRNLKIGCLYRERNNTNCVLKIKNLYKGVVGKDNIYNLYGIPMIPGSLYAQTGTLDYRTQITDYGKLSEGNLKEFSNCDIKVLVLGGKDWEIQESEEVLELVKEYKKVNFLFNFLDGKSFQEIRQSMSRTKTFRIPYEPDAFKKPPSSSVVELIEEISKNHFLIDANNSGKKRLIEKLRNKVNL